MAYGKKSFRENRVDGYKCEQEHWDRIFAKPTALTEKSFKECVADLDKQAVVGVDVAKDGNVVFAPTATEAEQLRPAARRDYFGPRGPRLAWNDNEEDDV